MSTALQTTNVKTLVESNAYQNRIKQLLGERAPQFVSALVQLSQDWKLKECEPNSVIAAAITAASLDLPINPNLGFAHLVPYKTTCTFQIGVKGFVQLANRSGQYKRLNVTEVYDGELLKCDRVRGEVILDEAKRTSDKVVGYVAYFELINGAEHAEYWGVDTVKKHAEKFSYAYRAKKTDSPWFTNFDAMAKKTVLKSLLVHWGPLSVQMQTAFVEDAGSKTSVDAAPMYPDNEPVIEEAPRLENGAKRGRPAKALSAAAEGQPAAPTADVAQPSVVIPLANRLATLILGTHKVPFDDLRSYLETTGIDKDASSHAAPEEIPDAAWEALAQSNDTLALKCIKIYGK